MAQTPEEIQAAVLHRFTRIANVPDQELTFPVGPDSAEALGYDVREIGSLPSAVTESFCGVGNPLKLAELQTGQTVLDLGSGAGLDCVLAARSVGPSGGVIGVDMTEAMIAKARRNAEMLDLQNVQFILCNMDALPLDDASVDVAISNGVFNLCPDKAKVLSEVCRVLRPGGRLQMTDMLLHEDVSPEEVAEKGTWSD